MPVRIPASQTVDPIHLGMDWVYSFFPLAFNLKVKLFLAEWTQRTVGEALSQLPSPTGVSPIPPKTDVCVSFNLSGNSSCAVAADAGYNTPAIAQCLLENEIHPDLPYTRPKSKEVLMKRQNLSMMNIIMTAIFVRENKNYLIERLRRNAIVSISPIPFIIKNVRFYLSAQKVKTIRS